MRARTLADIAAALGGRWLAPPPDDAALVTGASIDTRTLEAGQAFFAFKGEVVDGRDYISRAREMGAPVAFVDETPGAQCPPGVLLVDDLRAALAQLASEDRAARPDLRVVGVTGTNGKTTTTRLIESVLATRLRGRSSPKSFNNDLGLPLTILNSREDDQFVVCEMGTSSPGEIAALAEIARPDIAVITSIGRGHLEGLGSLAGVAREKASIVDGLTPGGVAIVTDDSPELDGVLAARAGVTIERVGESAGARWSIGSIRSGSDGVRFELGSVGELACPIPGVHNASNAAIAAAVGVQIGISPDDIRRGLSGAAAPDMRLSVESIAAPGGPITLINDAYNANPDSVRAALRTLATFEPGAGGRLVAVLGDMLEIGPDSDIEHQTLLEAAPPSIDLIVALGEAMSDAVNQALDGTAQGEALGEATDEAITRAAALVRPGDVVLLKASRAIRLERMAEVLRRAVGANAEIHSVPPLRTDGP